MAYQIFLDGVRMLWFVSGAIGFVELLRFLQTAFGPLRGRWPQALLFGLTTAAAMASLSLVPGGVDVKEFELVTPFLAMVAGAEGAILGGLGIAAAMPQEASITLSTAVAAALLAHYRKSPLWALPVAWFGIGLQGPLQRLLHGRVLHPLVDMTISSLGALAIYLYVREVDRRRVKLLQAESRATLDPLTGLLNRTGLAHWLAQSGTGALIAIDLDDFKPVNEIYGHAAGDAILVEEANRLRLALRPEDALARLGGDEFAAAVTGADVETAIAVAERMLQALDQDDLVLGEERLRVRASFGIATGRLPALLEAADMALLQAKADGKGRIRVYGEAHSRDPEEEQLLRVTSFARDLLFGISEGVVILGPSRRILAGSPAYEAMTGVSLAEAQGRKPHALFGTEITDPGLFAAIAESLDGSGVWKGELVNRRPFGEIWWADWSMRAVEVRGRRLGYFGIVRDMTATHRHEARLLAEAVGVLSEHHDPSIRGHLGRVGRYMELLVAAWRGRYGTADLPLNPEEYRIAATMHDIGKMAVPREILVKPGPLTEAERAIMDRHPVAGHTYLQQLCTRWCRGPSSSYVQMVLEVAMEIALNHHERLDGGGYPNGRRGGAIPLAARLFSAVDVYDALRAKRPYKEAWPEEDAFAHLLEGSGTAFDPAAVELLAALRGCGDWRSVGGQPA